MQVGADQGRGSRDDVTVGAAADKQVEPSDLLRAIVADGGGVAARVLAAWTSRTTASH